MNRELLLLGLIAMSFSGAMVSLYLYYRIRVEELRAKAVLKHAK